MLRRIGSAGTAARRNRRKTMSGSFSRYVSTIFPRSTRFDDSHPRFLNARHGLRMGLNMRLAEMKPGVKLPGKSFGSGETNEQLPVRQMVPVPSHQLQVGTVVEQVPATEPFYVPVDKHDIPPASMTPDHPCANRRVLRIRTRIPEARTCFIVNHLNIGGFGQVQTPGKFIRRVRTHKRGVRQGDHVTRAHHLAFPHRVTGDRWVACRVSSQAVIIDVATLPMSGKPARIIAIAPVTIYPAPVPVTSPCRLAPQPGVTWTVQVVAPAFPPIPAVRPRKIRREPLAPDGYVARVGELRRQPHGRIRLEIIRVHPHRQPVLAQVVPASRRVARLLCPLERR